MACEMLTYTGGGRSLPSSLLRYSRSSTMPWVRFASAWSLGSSSSTSTRSGYWVATSSWARIPATGLRSSCEASATKRFCCCWECCSRSSISFMVCGRRSIGSATSRVDNLRFRDLDEICCTSVWMASTLRSERLTAQAAMRPDVPATISVSSAGKPRLRSPPRLEGSDWLAEATR